MSQKKNGGILDVFLRVEQTVFAEEWNMDEREREVRDAAKPFSLNKYHSVFITDED